ncbi:MAG: redox-regulated ATPase YchF [Candidatus Auribacter fodinae]|uniref:Redox-regulated ATPase YchF n=1 Tax=Candidatus Auribacter fodinae TaxID=2093366 RepID=A0A3A4QZD0_9BACT|nr:MAG: redox-regulated ATPase YchF [Candidatus Auribacter fodinae]
MLIYSSELNHNHNEVSVKAGIIGLPQCGKTTVFNAMTNMKVTVDGYGGKGVESHVAAVKVPDERMDYLASVYNPKKLTYVDMTFVDIGCKKKANERSEFDMASIRGLDMLAVVIRAFRDEAVPHPLDRINPLGDVEQLQSEFLLEDLALIETRLERLEKDIKRNNKDAVKERDYLFEFQKHLEDEKPLRTYPLDSEGEKVFRGFQFLTLKPVLYIFNTGETPDKTVDLQSAKAYLENAGIPYIILSGNLEMEIAQLPEEDRALFLEDLKIDEPALSKFIKMSFSLLNRCVFFTVGPDEVRAWEITSTCTAREAAGKIHSDIARGFIRAEVLSYSDYRACGDSYQSARSKGLVRLEGKEYVVKDGDMIEFRFNV